MEHKIIGWFMGRPEVKWIAYDQWGEAVTWENTRKECEEVCRQFGYVPVRR